MHMSSSASPCPLIQAYWFATTYSVHLLKLGSQTKKHIKCCTSLDCESSNVWCVTVQTFPYMLPMTNNQTYLHKSCVRKSSSKLSRRRAILCQAIGSLRSQLSVLDYVDPALITQCSAFQRSELTRRRLRNCRNTCIAEINASPSPATQRTDRVSRHVQSEGVT